MPDSRSLSELIRTRRSTAAQLAAVIALFAQGRFGADPARTEVGAARGEVLPGLLRQILRMLTLMHSAQAAASSRGPGAQVQTAFSTPGGGGIGGIFGRILGGIASGLGLASLALGIIGLFRRGRAPESSPVPFQQPAALALEVANTDQILRGFPRFDFSARGEPRLVQPPSPPQPPTATAPAGQTAALVSPVQITVNVSAMDARSFSDHAPALAQAVREAMLHMHPINQVVRESF